MCTASQKRNTHLKRKGLVLAIATIVIGIPPSVYAQDSNQGSTTASAPRVGNRASTSTSVDKNVQTMKEIRVTGSLIPRVDIETASPVQELSISKIKDMGFTNIAQAVQAISANNSGSISNTFTGGFAPGSAGVALRGMSVSGTLVLVDGHRVANYALNDDGERSFVDLNTIPMDAVERIEVLKDSASSLYGADAVAGVVNIILRPSYRGGEINAEVGNSQHGGGLQKRVTGTFGAGDLQTQGYNVYFDFAYDKENIIRANQRGYPFNTSDHTRYGLFDDRVGDPSNFSGSNYAVVAPATLGTPGNILTGVQVPGTLFRPLASCGPNSEAVTTPGVGTYCAQDNTALYGAISPESKRANLHTRFTVKLNDQNTAYLDAYYAEASTYSPFRAHPIQSSIPTSTNAIALPPTLPDGSLNPNDPFAAQGQYALISYAFGGVLPTFINMKNHSFRVAGDLSGELGSWNYDANLTLNKTWLSYSERSHVLLANLLSAVENGTYNFVDPSKSASLLDTLMPVINSTPTSELYALDLTANRFFGQLAGGPIGVAVGFQSRRTGQDIPDRDPNQEFLSFSEVRVHGARTNYAAFGEIDMPLLASFDLNASGRESHSPFGTAFTPKVGFKWTPTEKFALRGTFAKGYKSPSFPESEGSATTSGAVGYSVAPGSALYEEHGGDPYVKRTYTLILTQAGNNNIKPETSKSYTFGMVLSPTHWLSGTLDYYHIKVNGVIVPGDTNAALDAYINGTALPEGVVVATDIADPNFPNARPRPVQVISPYVNANSELTSGVDFNLKGSFDIGQARLDSSIDATKILKWTVIFPGGGQQDYPGTHGPCNLSACTGTPRYRAAFVNTLSYGPWTGTATVSYTSGMFMSAPDLTGPGCASFVLGPNGTTFPLNCHTSSFTSVDLTGSWRINPKLTITGAILNVLDRAAPFDAMAGTYDAAFTQSGAIGRFFRLGVQLKL